MINLPPYLRSLESEAITIFREVIAQFKNPVMLYSIGKDSSVLLRLAQKAFFPGKIPFPLMHIDTNYKFPEMYEFKEKVIKELGAELFISENQEGIKKGAHPTRMGADKCCGFLKTRALLDGIKENNFDAAFGGARREEEKSRAKERVFSFRDRHGQWDPKNQRPELWSLYNGKIHPDETVRIFPLSNWTEIDIWEYILYEEIPLVSLYFAKEREVVRRNGIIMPVEYYQTYNIDGKEPLDKKEIEVLSCRYRSLGCIPCTGAITSKALTVPDIIKELKETNKSERENRVIDLTSDSSMEQKKREGYF